MRQRFVTAAGAIGLMVVAPATAFAFCSSVAQCTKSDFKTAAAAQGCGLLFIESRHANCTAAAETLHTAESCGPPNPPACASTQDNKAILKRLQACLRDRTRQQAAFSSGLDDVAAAEKVKFPQDQVKDIKGYLAQIKGGIQAGQPGHAQQIEGVKIAIANCKRFP